MNTLNIAKKLGLLAVSTAFLFVSACKKDPQKIANPGPTFSLDKFETELKNSMEPSGAKAWAYIINQNGLYARGKAYGDARTTADGQLNFTLNKKINLASVSKFLTAIAVMQLLEERKININARVAPWLPPSWSRGTGVDDLTFADLLSHRSGMSSVNTNFSNTLGYTGLRTFVATGVTNPAKPRNYLNANFALFRVIIPSLWRGLPDAPDISSNLDSLTTETMYIKFMQDRVFEPIGINGANCEPEARASCTLYYANTDNNNSSNGLYYGSWTSMAGGGGYFLSSMELARVLAYFRHTEILMSKEQRQIMEENRFGFNQLDDNREIHGSYYSKNGSIINNGQGIVSEIVLFPNGIEVVTVFNTQGMVFAGGVTATSSAIYDAYNKSWE
ncbi:MAG: serine hydrolase [Bacteroidetes bacterium]|nr:serine hydrolase [Bacteroidota bacterium]